MNIIVNGFVNNILRPIIHDYLKVRNVSKCYFIDNRIEYEKDEIITYFDFRDLTWAQYDVNWYDLIPLDKSLIEKMYPCEVRVMKMMERIEQHAGKISYKERRSIYYRHLQFWNDLIEKNNINLFLSGNIPHENYDFIIYSLCKLKGIKTFFFYQTMPDFPMLMSDWNPFFIEIKHSYEKLLKNSSSPEEIQLEKRSDNILAKQLNSNDESIPFYRTQDYYKELKKRSKQRKLHRSIIKLTSASFYKRIFNQKNIRIGLYRLIGRKIQLLQSKHLSRIYSKLAISPDLDVKFIYLPLHFQPELTTNPLADCFVDQKLIIDILSSAVPEDFRIYVKENPIQKRWSRSSNFYRQIHNIPNVDLISSKTDTYNLISKSVAVATAAGTAGWEGLFREKPVLLFGNIFYQYADGVFMCGSAEECEQAIRKIVVEKIKPDIQSIRLYLKAMEKVTVPGYYAFYYQTGSELNLEENHDTLLNHLISRTAN